MQKRIQPSACLDHGLHVLKPRSFTTNCAPKMRERHKLFSELPLMSKDFQHPTIKTKLEQHFGGFFHHIKVIRTSRRLDSFLHKVADKHMPQSHFTGKYFL
jgi:hypothetical protein